MSEFWKRKMRTYFSKFDFDNDGVISKDDFDNMAIRIANFKTADKQKLKHLKTQFDNEWQQFTQVTETSDKTVLTIDMFTDSISKQRYDPELMKQYSNMMHAIFELMDVNCDGYLQEDEYHKIHLQLGMPDAPYARKTFRTIDVHRNGKLSFDEIINAFFDFLFSEDEESPHKFFFGPLVD